MIASNITGITGVNGVQVIPTAPVAAEEVKGASEPLPLPKESQASSQASAASKKAVNEKVQRSMTVEEYVRNYFSDIPIMIEVAKCESRFRQYDANGEVLRGEENSLDRGVMQINEYYHNEDSAKLGFDILTLEGNTAYARYIFERYGVSPWKPSSPCWSKTTAYANYSELAVR